jgi:sulfur-oxidizing protein SoxB
MLGRREFLEVAAAMAVSFGSPAALGQAVSRGRIAQDDLLRFDALGQVTLLHFADIHAQLVPLDFREPSVNLGVGEVHGLPPHITGKDLIRHFGLRIGSPEAYALSSEDFVGLARRYGRVGGLDRIATIVKAVRAERPGRTLLLDGGDTWQGSYVTLKEQGADMVEAMTALGVDAMTAHWEFTLGAERVKQLTETLKFPFLAGNVRDTEWEEPVFKHTAMVERGGVNIAIIGQAFPYTPIANPRYMMPKWSFGIREDELRKNIAAARAAGADLVVLLSHNGFDVDRKLASRVEGIDVILTGHTHDAIPAVIKVGRTLLVASGSHGKFVARLDLDVKNRKVADFRFKLIPVLADAIAPDAEMAKLVARLRAPHEAELNKVLGRTESLLYRRGNFNGTFDDLILAALQEERDAEIALSPGFRWGSSLLPGTEIRAEDVYNQTAITYPNVYRNEMSGKLLKDIMEDVADNLFHPDPYYQQGGDMVRIGGMSYAIDVRAKMGSRISDMRLTRTGKPIEADKTYVVAGWASVQPGTKGPPVYDLVKNYVSKQKTIRLPENRNIRISGA